jgi:anti-sigma B factor antagonist
VFTDIAARLPASGEAAAHRAPEWPEQLAARIGDDDVEVDFSAVEFMDSSGLRVVIDAHQQALAAGSRLVVHAPSTSVRKIVEISGLADHLFLD